jgi:hypothetical protein
MKIYFYDRDTLKKELKNKSNKTISVRFKTHNQIIIPKQVLTVIQQISKKDRTFLKKLLSTENNFIFFLSNFIKS